MADSSTVHGFDVLATKLREIPQAMRKKVVRNSLAAGARLVRDEAKRKAPVLKKSAATAQRKPGTVRNAIKVRTSKQSRRNGDVGVFVNVKPLKTAQIRAFKAGGGGSGYKNPDDPFYWRWLEFGRTRRVGVSARNRVARIKRKGVELLKGVRARRALRGVGAMAPFGFLQAGARRLPDAFRIFERQVLGWFAKTNRTGKVDP